jgi:transposase
MGNPAGMRRDFDALERRRMQAIKLLRQGLNQSEVARRVKVCSQTVSRWNQTLSEQGEAALKKAGRAGRKPKLAATKWQRLEELLLRGPEALGYETPLWTCQRVAHLLEQEFDVDYHPGHVWKMLGAMGWSCQRPEGRARERNAGAVQHWQKVQWPAIKKKPKLRGARLSSWTKAE